MKKKTEKKKKTTSDSLVFAIFRTVKPSVLLLCCFFFVIVYFNYFKNIRILFVVVSRSYLIEVSSTVKAWEQGRCTLELTLNQILCKFGLRILIYLPYRWSLLTAIASVVRLVCFKIRHFALLKVNYFFFLYMLTLCKMRLNQSWDQQKPGQLRDTVSRAF